MANMLLATPILSDAAVLSASTFPAGLPVGNLQRSPIGEVCRLLDPENAFIQIDMGAAHPIRLIALLGHNGSSRGHARIRAAAQLENLETTPDYDSGEIPIRSHQQDFDSDSQIGALPKNHCIHVPGVIQAYQFWRIDITDTEVPYLDIGRLYLADPFQPETNMDYGIQDGFIDPSSTARAYSGKLISNERPMYRAVDLKLSFGTESEMYGQLFEIDRLRGTTRDVLLISDPDNLSMIQKRTIYGVMKNLSQVVNSYLGASRRASLLDGLRKISDDPGNPEELVRNQLYAAAMCRIFYARIPALLPAENDWRGMGEYWKRYYNTRLGKGTVDGFMQKAAPVFALYEGKR